MSSPVVFSHPEVPDPQRRKSRPTTSKLLAITSKPPPGHLGAPDPPLRSSRPTTSKLPSDHSKLPSNYFEPPSPPLRSCRPITSKLSTYHLGAPAQPLRGTLPTTSKLPPENFEAPKPPFGSCRPTTSKLPTLRSSSLTSSTLPSAISKLASDHPEFPNQPRASGQVASGFHSLC